MTRAFAITCLISFVATQDATAKIRLPKHPLADHPLLIGLKPPRALDLTAQGALLWREPIGRIWLPVADNHRHGHEYFFDKLTGQQLARRSGTEHYNELLVTGYGAPSGMLNRRQQHQATLFGIGEDGTPFANARTVKEAAHEQQRQLSDEGLTRASPTERFTNLGSYAARDKDNRRLLQNRIDWPINKRSLRPIAYGDFGPEQVDLVSVEHRSIGGVYRIQRVSRFDADHADYAIEKVTTETKVPADLRLYVLMQLRPPAGTILKENDSGALAGKFNLRFSDHVFYDVARPRDHLSVQRIIDPVTRKILADMRINDGSAVAALKGYGLETMPIDEMDAVIPIGKRRDGPLNDPKHTRMGTKTWAGRMHRMPEIARLTAGLLSRQRGESISHHDLRVCGQITTPFESVHGIDLGRGHAYYRVHQAWDGNEWVTADPERLPSEPVEHWLAEAAR